MKRTFDFVLALGESFLDFYGRPTIKCFEGCIEVYFDCKNPIRDLSVLSKLSSKCDKFRMFSNGTDIVIVFVFEYDV